MSGLGRTGPKNKDRETSEEEQGREETLTETPPLRDGPGRDTVRCCDLAPPSTRLRKGIRLEFAQTLGPRQVLTFVLEPNSHPLPLPRSIR